MIKRLSDSVKSTYKNYTGVILAAAATVLWAVCVGALNLQSGFGRLADFLFVSVVACIGVPLVALAVALVLWLLRRLPQLLVGFLVAATVLVSLLWFTTPGQVGVVVAAVLLAVECVLGAALAVLARGASGKKRLVAVGFFVLAVAANAGMFNLLHSDGTKREMEMLQIERKSGGPPLLTADDPSKPGPYKVKTLYYGSGTSLRRAEFGPSVAIRTRTVDASPFFKDFDGWKAWIRTRYWGFGMDKLPLNARVFYPEGQGPFPLFVMVHGNHRMSVPSDEGYAYLCELLASRGFIAVSVDENFLNSGLFHEPPNQQPVRGWLLLEHLRLWHEWAKDPKSPFCGKVDLSRIALAGHSKGGEAAATAALFNNLKYYPDDANIQFNYGYAIRSVIAIAPADGQYKPADQWRNLQDVNYLTLQGAHDADVSTFEGSGQYERVKFSGNIPAFKSELYIYGANHGQFNTLWGREDVDTPASWFLNLAPLMKGDAQRQIAKLYVSAFLEATLRGRSEYQELFRDYRRGCKWLPETLYVNRFEDERYKAISSFDEDSDLTTTTVPGGQITGNGLSVWYEGKIPARRGTREHNAVFLGWNWQREKKPPANVPNYSIELPPGMSAPILTLSVAVSDDDAPDLQDGDDAQEKNGMTNFSVEALSANGASARVEVNRFGLLLPPLHVRLTKLERLDRKLYGNSVEPVFQTISIPFAAFVKQNPAIDPRQIRQIRLIFDGTPARVIIISGIGLEGA